MSPAWKLRFTTEPLFSSRNVPETPLNTGSWSRSSGSGSTAPAGTGNSVPATRLLVSAPVGQLTMHSPQETQVDSPIGLFRSKATPALAPFSMRPSTRFCRISLQPRMQRSHRMQAS